MKDGIMLVAIIAIFTYVLVPETARAIGAWRRSRLLHLIATKKALTGTCGGYDGKKITIETGASAPIEINPKKARFYLLKGVEAVDRIRWKSVTMIDKDREVSLILPEKWRIRTICLFAEPAADGKPVEQSIGPVCTQIKYFSVASGAFLEFLVFLYSISKDGQTLLSILSLVAIFGKALPYCPPGLFLTLLAHSQGSARRKKSRGRKVGGFLLVAIGIALNIAVILFVIRQVGFVFP